MGSNLSVSDSRPLASESAPKQQSRQESKRTQDLDLGFLKQFVCFNTHDAEGCKTDHPDSFVHSNNSTSCSKSPRHEPEPPSHTPALFSVAGLWVGEEIPDQRPHRFSVLHSEDPAWSQEQEDTLERAVLTFCHQRGIAPAAAVRGAEPDMVLWHLVARHVPGKTAEACLDRYRAIQDSAVARFKAAPRRGTASGGGGSGSKQRQSAGHWDATRSRAPPLEFPY
jgi:hypothetical protein